MNTNQSCPLMEYMIEEIQNSMKIGVFSNSVYQGCCTADYTINKCPPSIPLINVSAKSDEPLYKVGNMSKYFTFVTIKSNVMYLKSPDNRIIWTKLKNV